MFSLFPEMTTLSLLLTTLVLIHETVSRNRQTSKPYGKLFEGPKYGTLY